MYLTTRCSRRDWYMHRLLQRSANGTATAAGRKSLGQRLHEEQGQFYLGSLQDVMSDLHHCSAARSKADAPFCAPRSPLNSSKSNRSLVNRGFFAAAFGHFARAQR